MHYVITVETYEEQDIGDNLKLLEMDLNDQMTAIKQEQLLKCPDTWAVRLKCTLKTVNQMTKPQMLHLLNLE